MVAGGNGLFTFATVCLCLLFIITVSHRLRGLGLPLQLPLHPPLIPFHPSPFLTRNFLHHLLRTAIRPCLRATRPPSNFENTTSWYSSH